LDYTEVLEAGPAHRVTVSNLQNTVTYYFAVTSVDLTGLESPFSEELTFNFAINAETRHIRQSVPFSGATQPAAAFILSWPGAVTNVNLWQSADLLSWSPLTNVFGPGDSFLITPSLKPRFYRATSAEMGGTNLLRLWFRKF